MTSLNNSSQSTRPVGRVTWEELLILSRFYSYYERTSGIFVPCRFTSARRLRACTLYLESIVGAFKVGSGSDTLFSTVAFSVIKIDSNILTYHISPKNLTTISGQTVQIQIRLLLKELSDQGLHYLKSYLYS